MENNKYDHINDPNNQFDPNVFLKLIDIIEQIQAKYEDKLMDGELAILFTLKRIINLAKRISDNIIYDAFAMNRFQCIMYLNLLTNKCDELMTLVNEQPKKFLFVSLEEVFVFIEAIIAMESEDAKIIYNSEDYYQNKIEDTIKTKNAAIAAKQDLERKLAAEQKASGANSRKLSNQISELDNKLETANNLITQYQNEQNEQKKRDDVISQWDKKISNIFSRLETCIDPIKDEHWKLKMLFYIYGALSGLIVLLIIAIEIVIYKKMCVLDGLPTFDNYFALALPIPIAIGLLCGFITQVNRAQLQMVVLSRHIHEVKYTEGLLLAINGLTTNTNDSTRRINDAIDKLLEKHLADNSHNMGWDTCVKSEEQSLSSNELIKILKEIKGLVAK